MPAGDEQHLISRAREGSHEAFRVLVERHMKHAYNIAFGFVGNHEDAAEVAQEAFVRAHRGLPSFREDAGFGTWLHRVVVNLSQQILWAYATRDDFTRPSRKTARASIRRWWMCPRSGM